MAPETTLHKLERVLRERFAPEVLEIEDDTPRHAGHPGASSGGGHFRVRIVSAAFAGRSLLQRHRMVYEALGPMIGGEIHALGLRTETPEEAG